MAFTEKYVTNAGAGVADGSSLANAWSWATMLTTLAAGQRANVQGAITRTTSNDVFTNAGSSTNPIAIRGINSTLDDLEANGRTRGGALVTTNFPVVTYTTGSLAIQTAMICEHFSITSAKAGATLLMANAGGFVRRVSVANTHASSASALAVDMRNTSAIVDCDCSCISSSSSAAAISANTTQGVVIKDCSLTGNVSGAGCILGTVLCYIHDCCLRDAGFGISNTTPLNLVFRCSFRNITNIHIKGACRNVSNCVAWGSAGSSQWFSNAGTIPYNMQLNNFVGNMGAADADEGNWPTRYETTLTADPFTSSTDLTLNNTAGGGAAVRAAGYPAYLDGGAWQHQDAGGGGLMVRRSYSGGFQ